MEYLKVWVSFREDISMLNDAEKGRLFDAMLLYAANGKESDLKGNERFVWPGAKQAIDRTARKNEVQRMNGSKGGRPRNQQLEETQRNPIKPSETRKEKKEVVVVADKDTEKNNEEYIFGLTDNEIQASLEMEGQIEELARYVGLETTLAALDKAKDLARKYGLENLLEAMREAVDVHTWRYVRGILEKGGVQKKDQHASGTVYRDGVAYYVDENGDEVRWLDS